MIMLGFENPSLLTFRPLCRYLGVGSSHRRSQWQARILYEGKVTHLGYYRTEEEAARVYDRVALSLHGPKAQVNFPATSHLGHANHPLAGLTREEVQRKLGVKPMDKSSQYRGVSKKKGKWEAKVMVNRKCVSDSRHSQFESHTVGPLII